MSKRIGQTPFVELLPHSISGDETIRRVSYALDGPLDSVAESIPDLLIFSRLAKDSGEVDPVPLLPPLERLAALSDGLRQLPEDVIDLLAWQLHVERYETAASLSAKRAMVFSSVILHRKRGTPWAVKHGLETTLQVPAKISEWFEYGGEPYFFRVELDVSGVMIDARAVENAVKVIFAHKNVRSWLEFLRTKSVRKLPVFIAAGEVNFSKMLAFTWRWPLIFDGFSSFYGAIPDGRTCVAIAFKNAPSPEIELQENIGLCAAGMSESWTRPGFFLQPATLSSIRASICYSRTGSFILPAFPEDFGETRAVFAFTIYSFTRSQVCPRQI